MISPPSCFVIIVSAPSLKYIEFTLLSVNHAFWKYLLASSSGTSLLGQRKVRKSALRQLSVLSTKFFKNVFAISSSTVSLDCPLWMLVSVPLYDGLGGFLGRSGVICLDEISMF